MTPYETAVARFNGKKVLILGLGLLGGASGDARFFSTLGAMVRATDQKTSEELNDTLSLLSDLPIEYTLGGHDKKDIEWADYIVRNPSVPVNHPLLDLARTMNKSIVMRSSLFVELANVFTIGITGTRGKTTTTAMIYELVRQFSGKQTVLGGNIAGVSDLELLSTISDPENTIAVMELSSWQLQGFAESHISPNLAVMTNLFPDHLNKYPNLAAYYQDKRNILQFQQDTDVAVLNADVSEFQEWVNTAPGKVVWYQASDIPSTMSLSIPGLHNRENAAAALKVAEILGFPLAEVESVLSSFKGVPFRLETVGQKFDITYINDTTATTPIATIRALQSINNPIVICGGADKNLPIEELVTALNEKAKKIILLPGTGTDRIRSLLSPSLLFGEVKSMAEAVTLARNAAVPGDSILLSPGFASFGLFNNEFDRGNQFNQCVQTLV